MALAPKKTLPRRSAMGGFFAALGLGAAMAANPKRAGAQPQFYSSNPSVNIPMMNNAQNYQNSMNYGDDDNSNGDASGQDSGGAASSSPVYDPDDPTYNPSAICQIDGTNCSQNIDVQPTNMPAWWYKEPDWFRNTDAWSACPPNSSDPRCAEVNKDRRWEKWFENNETSIEVAADVAKGLLCLPLVPIVYLVYCIATEEDRAYKKQRKYDDRRVDNTDNKDKSIFERLTRNKKAEGPPLG